jgi:hypothetical protein
MENALGTTTYSWVDPGIQFVGDDAIAVELFINQVA